MSNDRSERHPIDELAEEFVARYRRGERPAVSEYVRLYPDLADQVQEVLQALVVIEELRPARTNSSERGKIMANWHAVSQLGEYRILHEVGRGGMGVVYEAEQESLGRHVALKVLPFSTHTDPTQLERFRREARAAARLHHTNIVPVFDVGEQDGVHYYAMQYIHGQAIDEVLREVKRLRGAEPIAGPIPAPQNASLSQSNRLAKMVLSGHISPAGSEALPENAQPSCSLQASLVDPLSAASPGTDHPNITAKPLTAAGRDPRAESAAEIAAKTSDGLGTAVSATSLVSRAGLSSGPDLHLRYFWGVARIGEQIAEALCYAHGQGVLHRDIKPSNLLLDTRGTIWLTDFGLAKTDDSSDITHTGDIVGTLRYLAPERLKGWSDPRSDVYGLGMTLYEMLTLRPAFEETDRARLVRQITSFDPPRPRKIDRRIPHDLETIVLKAIAKEPGKRYQSAAEMGEDLHCFAADRPIRARRARLAERGWRWCRRNPVVAGLVTALIAVFLGGFVGVFGQWRRAELNWAHADLQRLQAESNLAEAERQRTRAEENVRLALQALDRIYVQTSEREFPRDAQRERVDRELLEQGLKFYEAFARQNETEPKVRFEAARAYERAGWLYGLLRQPQKCEEHYQHGIQLLGQLLLEFPQSAEYRNLLILCHYNLASARGWMTNHRLDAEKSFRQALALAEQLTADFPNVPEYQQSLANILGELGAFLRATDRPEEGERLLRQAIPLLLKLTAEFPTHRGHRYYLTRNYFFLGRLLSLTGRPWEAEETYRKALVLIEKLVDESPRNRLYQTGLARANRELGMVLNTVARYQEAEDVLRRAVGIEEKLAAQYPNMPVHQTRLQDGRQHLANALYNEAWELATAADPQARAVGRALQLAKEAVSLAPGNYAFWNTLGLAQYRAHDWKAAIAAVEKSMQLARRGDAYDWFILAMAHWQLGDRKKADQYYLQAVGWIEKQKSLPEDLCRLREEAAVLLGKI